MEKGLDVGGQPNSSSDFVRKLFKMLEDPTYREIVRWADGGETFVVLENEKFTKMVLPKHFKHSNFASFVRQLNKYDFHKVRQNSEDSTPSPYGPNAWEFKHPEFQEHKKDLLDNIKRKAPAPRKPQANLEDQFPSQQLDLLNSQLIASQQQIKHLTETYNELAQNQVKLLQQIVELQKLVKKHEGVMQIVIYSVDTQSRNSRIGYNSGLGNGEMPNDGSIDDNVASSLQEATNLLRECSAENPQNKELEQMSNNFMMRSNFSIHQGDLSANSINLQPTNQRLAYPGSNEMETVVYPVGSTDGIDPIQSEHIHNIPYPPLPNMMLQNPMPEMAHDNSVASKTKKVGGVVKAVWVGRKPNILLVEDDKVCARIGTKFLQAFEYGVETAFDGMEAVSKVTTNPASYDLILMDIIMPRLDGVSATVCIKEMRPNLPIIAMTSNIRADDIQMYFSHGMDDVLPKPFTKEGMLRALEKHLPENKEPIFQSPNQTTHAVDFRSSTSSHTPLNIEMGQIQTTQLKTEPHSDKATTAVSIWDPSNQLELNSPAGGAPAGYMRQPMGDTFNMNSSISHSSSGTPNFVPPQQNSAIVGQQRLHQRRPHSEITSCGNEGPSEKRQRIFSHQTGGFSL